MESGTLAIPMRITGNPKLQNQKEVAPAGFSATSSQIMTLRSTATEKRFDHNYSRHYEIISKYVTIAHAWYYPRCVLPLYVACLLWALNN